ncbi:MAG TPA: dTDP-4-dehydrorhamnose 3,5-epimerase [Bacteroidales bacterium]|nr:dTDP-4-dehydrorhamnose 3,5-epimerase [Bacteroidales bacterium]
MKIVTTDFPGLVIIEPSVFKDSRGYFFESYNLKDFLGNNIVFNPVQDNESSSQKGVIRGLHYQLNPMAQAKLIRVIRGSILDVAVDLRKGSPTYGLWKSVELNSEEKRQLFIPRGFAHGFSVISDDAIILYKCDNLYSPGHERGILYNDPDLGIDWEVDHAGSVISDKDRHNPLFKDAQMNFRFDP